MTIPAPPATWVTASGLIDDAGHRERVQQMLEWIARDEGGFLSWRTGDLQAEDLKVMDTAFAVALVHLHTGWSTFNAPVAALEDLVSAFGVGGLGALWVGDGNLPPDIAGAGCNKRADWAHRWEARLGGYVCALFEESRVSEASPLAARYLQT